MCYSNVPVKEQLYIERRILKKKRNGPWLLAEIKTTN